MDGDNIIAGKRMKSIGPSKKERSMAGAWTQTNGPRGAGHQGEKSGVQLGKYTGAEKLNRKASDKSNGSDANKGGGRHTTL